MSRAARVQVARRVRAARAPAGAAELWQEKRGAQWVIIDGRTGDVIRSKKGPPWKNVPRKEA